MSRNAKLKLISMFTIVALFALPAVVMANGNATPAPSVFNSALTSAAMANRSTAPASTPSVFTSNAYSTSKTAAIVDGYLTADGETTHYWADYGLASSEWCTTNGSKGSPEHSTSHVELSATEFNVVAVELTPLTTNKEYCAEVVAEYGTGTAHGRPVTFTAGAPSIYFADNIVLSTGATTATVEGIVFAAAQTTQYSLDYAPAGSEWCTSRGANGSPEHSTGSTNGTAVLVKAKLSGLSPGSEYCVGWSAENETAAARFSGQFTFTAGAPAALTFSPARNIGVSTATIEGEVNPAGQTTSYHVAYGSASSEWCKSFGSQGKPEGSTASQTLAFSDGVLHMISVNVTGLSAGTEYCAELVASNASGSSHGPIHYAPVTFKTERGHTLTVSLAGTGSGTVSGTGMACPGTCSGAYPSGTRVTLTATPASGSTFAGWSGACTGTGACEVTLSEDRHVTASFAAKEETPHNHNLTVSLAGTGSGTVGGPGISCPGTCSGGYSSGTRVALTATPASGSTFAGWSGACTGTGACEVTLSEDQRVTASFTREETPPTPATSVNVGRVKITAKSVMVTIKTSRTGTVTVTGPGLKKTVTVLAAGTHVVTVPLTKAGRAERKSHRKIKLTVSLKTSEKSVSSSVKVKL